MTVDRHIIWSNYDLDYEDWRDDLEAEYPDLTEGERIALMYEINGDYLDDDTDYSTWYVDRLGDLRCDAIHHDGTNHYLYRTYKPGVRQSQIEKLKEKLYFGTATRADITRITRRLGDDIAKVYGFSILRQRQEQAAER